MHVPVGDEWRARPVAVVLVCRRVGERDDEIHRRRFAAQPLERFGIQARGAHVMVREEIDHPAACAARRRAAGAVGAKAAVTKRGEDRLGHQAERAVVLADE